MEQAQETERRTDGQSGGPVLTGQNAALKEGTPDAGDGVNPNHPQAAHVRIIDRERAIIESDRRKYAICGFASSTRPMIPVNDPAWEIWGMNQLYRHVKRADRWFDVHWNWNQELVPGTDHEGWIRDCGIPVYMIETHPHLPTTVRFPIDVLIDKFTDYYTSTVAHMTALAVWEIDRKVEGELEQWAARAPSGKKAVKDVMQKERDLYATYSIGFFGIDLVVGEEYFWQKPCAEFWIGLAVGRGIEVFVPRQSALCKQQFRYGYQTEPDSVIKPKELQAHGANIIRERDELLKRIAMLDGAAQADEYWHQVVELRLRGADIKS